MDETEGIPPLPDKWDRCHAYNDRKRRYCRQMPLPFSVSGQCSNTNTITNNHQPRYCGNHRQLMDEWLKNNGHDLGGDNDGESENALKRPRTTNSPAKNNGSKPKKNKKKDRGKRVPCPIDPSHFIFESAISKHVLVCPAIRQKQEVEGKEYYCEGINLGGFGGMGSVGDGDGDDVGPAAAVADGNETATGAAAGTADMEDAKELAHAILRVFHSLFLSSNGNNDSTMRSLDLKDGQCKNLTNQQLQKITEKDIYKALAEVDLSGVEEGTTCIPCQPSSKDTKINEKESKQTKDNATSTKTGRLTQAIAKNRIKAGGERHLRQIASILGHVRQNGLMSTTPTTNESETENNANPLIVEMGAGRGMTGLIVAGAMGASLSRDTNPSITNNKVNLCLVERAGTRGKAETKVRTAEGGKDSNNDECLRLDRVEVTRVKCDLAHVDMSKALPSHMRSNPSSKTVVIAKHLCGAGTDLALKSLCKMEGRIDGCVMATCCHGLCTWKEYVGRDSFLRLFCSEVGGLSSFGEKEFNLMKRWTAASVLEDSPDISKGGADDSPTVNSDVKDEHYNASDAEGEKGRYPGIFTVVKESGLLCGKGLGRACQRLIDYGRCEFIRNDLLQVDDSSSHEGGFNVKMLHYVPRDVTPQNALIVALREG